MPEYFGPRSLEALAALVNEDLKDSSNGSGSVVEGPPGPQGPPGETPFIGENGNWWIGDVDTGVRAEGSSAPGSYQFDETYFNIADDRVSLKTTDTYSSDTDKALPMTAAGVETIVGNIDILLQTI